mgnify:CR=1 FL=1|tara:strand:- start:13998 stop:14402 length:405 start_codon:yes stop_codon:yes gene_type:complete
MEYQFVIEKPGRGAWLYQFLSNNLDTFDTASFDLKSVSRDGDKVILDVEIDIDRLVSRLAQGIFLGNLYFREEGFIVKAVRTIKRARSRGKFKSDDPKTPENEAWEGGKAPPKKKKAAPRKRKVVAKKAPAKKK